MGLHPTLFCLYFYLLYFVLPPFEDNGLPFWVPGVLCQHSEVVYVVAIDMHRGHLDPDVATLPLPAERCAPVIKRAAALFAGVRPLGVPVIHVVTENRDPGEIAA